MGASSLTEFSPAPSAGAGRKGSEISGPAAKKAKTSNAQDEAKMSSMAKASNAQDEAKMSSMAKASSAKGEAEASSSGLTTSQSLAKIFPFLSPFLSPKEIVKTMKTGRCMHNALRLDSMMWLDRLKSRLDDSFVKM